MAILSGDAPPADTSHVQVVEKRLVNTVLDCVLPNKGDSPLYRIYWTQRASYPLPFSPAWKWVEAGIRLLGKDTTPKKDPVAVPRLRS